MAGHWAIHGAGMFAVEEKHSGKFVGRVGPWFPPTWPDFEVGWGITREAQGKGYATEAARGAIDWAFANFEIAQVIHCIDRENIASQGVARRLGAEKQTRDRAVRPCRGYVGHDTQHLGGAAELEHPEIEEAAAEWPVKLGLSVAAELRRRGRRIGGGVIRPVVASHVPRSLDATVLSRRT